MYKTKNIQQQQKVSHGECGRVHMARFRPGIKVPTEGSDLMWPSLNKREAFPFWSVPWRSLVSHYKHIHLLNRPYLQWRSRESSFAYEAEKCQAFEHGLSRTHTASRADYPWTKRCVEEPALKRPSTQCRIYLFY